MGKFEVASPATQYRVYPLDDVGHFAAPLPAQQFLEPVAQAAQAQSRYSKPRLFMPAHPISQVVTLPRSGYSALFQIQRQFQSPIQKALNAVHRPFASTKAAYINVRIICITHEAMTPTLKLSVEFVEQDVQQQRPKRASLRRALPPSADDTARHHTGFEVATDQFEHALVFNMALHMGHQDVVIDSIKELLKIKLTDQRFPATTWARPFRRLDERFCPDGSRSRDRRTVVKDRRELLQQSLLDQAVHDTGDIQLPCGNSLDLPAYACRIYVTAFRANTGL